MKGQCVCLIYMYTCIQNNFKIVISLYSSYVIFALDPKAMFSDYIKNAYNNDSVIVNDYNTT